MCKNENELAVVNVRGDSVLVSYGSFRFVVFYYPDTGKIELPKRLWVVDKDLYNQIARLVENAWVYNEDETCSGMGK